MVEHRHFPPPPIWLGLRIFISIQTINNGIINCKWFLLQYHAQVWHANATVCQRRLANLCIVSLLWNWPDFSSMWYITLEMSSPRRTSICTLDIELCKKNCSYCVSKKEWPILYSKLLYKLGHFFLDMQ